MSSNTSPAGTQHQGEASQGETTVLSTPYGQPEGVRRQSVFQAAAKATAPQAHSANTASSGTSAEQSSTEEIEAITPAATSEPGSGSEPDDQSTIEGASGTESTVSTGDSATAVPVTNAFPALTSTAAEPSSTEPRRRRRWPLGVAAAALLLLGVAGAGGYAYAAHYDGRAVPGTTVAGTDVSGKSRQEVVAAIEERAKSTKVDISGDVTASASLADLGTTVDAQATADAVMARGDTLGEKFRALVSQGKSEVPVVSTTDKTKVSSYATSLIPEDRAKARNATVVLGEDGTTFTTTSSANGSSLDANTLAQAAQKAATSLDSSSISLTITDAAPKVSDSDAQKVADKANGWVSQDVTITMGEDSYTAENTDKASWITITNSTESAPTIAVDSSKVSQWVKAKAEEASSEPVTGERNVNASGQVVSTPTEAKDGKTVNNADAVATSITQSLGSNKAYSGSFEATTVKAEWKDRTIANGAEKLPYQAAPGEKWVDLNLSNKTVTAYEGATVVHGPVSIVDGAAETPTVTGTYKVYLQYESQTMRGENADGSPYVAEDVPWVSYFYSGYAFHGAGWRSSFGYSGSHGCVNMPVPEAQLIYNWVDTNTVVHSHYWAGISASNSRVANGAGHLLTRRCPAPFVRPQETVRGPPSRSATKPSSSRIVSPSSRALVSLEPALSPTTTKLVFFETLPEALPPRETMASLALSRVNPSREPVTTTVRPSRVRAGSSCSSESSSRVRTPAASQRLRISRCQSTSRHLAQDSAMVGPTPSTSASSAMSAWHRASRDLKRAASARAAVGPT